MSEPPRVERPGDLEEAAHWPLIHLAELLRTRQVKSVELTDMYLQRLKKHNPRLNCVVTLTEDLAMSQARAADAEIAAGRYWGPLHGIPWGCKDILSVKGYPTTWGAAPFRDRVLDLDATVVQKLAGAGAVLVAKLTTGELALDDVWFGGRTNNPWDVSMGSQGSSAGPASATAAGLVGFSIGTETGGSIVEPSGICGVTGLRPTFGRVSRHGVMALSWSLDKVGPMCRSVEDCAVVLNVIQGADGEDGSAVDTPFNWDAALDVKRLRVGYLASAYKDTRQTKKVEENDAATLETLRSRGIDLVPVELPEGPYPDLFLIILADEAAALHDPLATSSGDLKRQDRVLGNRAARLLPAVEYIQSQRLRTELMRKMDRLMATVDVYAVPFDYADYTPNPIATRNTHLTNLTGHPSVTLPNGFNEKGTPTSVTFIGKLFGEAEMLAVAKLYQDATDWHRKRPPEFS
jgi:Asp-tRNA(Asn)/Glu-tRNA(Gln) amidotransferase A subunit family amidase